MPPRKSIEAAFSSMIGAAVRGAVREDIASLKREVRKLQNCIERTGAGGAPVRRGKGKPGRKPKFLVCQVAECKGKPVAWGFCQTHYNRYKYQGTLHQLAARISSGQQVRDEGTAEAPRGRKGALRRARGKAALAAATVVAARRRGRPRKARRGRKGR